MVLNYDILELISHNEKGLTLKDLYESIPNVEKREIAKVLSEDEFLGIIRGDWIKNDENRWERRYFIGYDLPDGPIKLFLKKLKKQKT